MTFHRNVIGHNLPHIRRHQMVRHSFCKQGKATVFFLIVEGDWWLLDCYILPEITIWIPRICSDFLQAYYTAHLSCALKIMILEVIASRWYFWYDTLLVEISRFSPLPDGWSQPHKSNNPTHLNPKPCILPRHVSKLLNFAAFLSGSAAADEAQKKVPKNTLQRKDKSVTWTGRCWWSLNGRVWSKGMGWMGVWTWESDRKWLGILRAELT